MKRNIVFFSHSSLDKAALMHLKGLVNARTSTSVDIFLSSDGQSIPFGRNWVYEVEKALEEASLMFVFITPNSINSHWMLFEAGFAYSKKVRVVPIGFIGVDVGAVAPPIGLLQGFNVVTRAELSNIVAIINEVFGSSFPVEFTDTEYDALMKEAGLASGGALGKLTVRIDEISIDLFEKNGLKATAEKMLSEIARLFGNYGIEHQTSENAVHVPGMKIFVKGSTTPTPLAILIDPILLNVSIPILNQVLAWAMPSKARGLSLYIKFNSSVDCITESHKVSARLFGSPAIAKDGKEFVIDGLDCEVYKSILIDRDRMRLPGNPVVRITPSDEEVSLEKIRNVLKLLFERGVLYYKE